MSYDPKEILLLDSTRTFLLCSHLLKDIRYKTVEKPSKYKILKSLLNPKMLLLSISFFIKSRKIRQSILMGYYYLIIEKCNPRIVIGFYICPRKSIFFELANKLNSIEFVGIYPSRIDANRKISQLIPSEANLYVYGHDDAEQLKQKGYRESLIHPKGSLYSHIFSDYFNNQRKNVEYDICILSQFLHQWNDKKPSEDRLLQKKISDLMLAHIKRFSKTHDGLRICIALRPQELLEAGSKQEEEYFRSRLSEINFTMIKSNEASGSSYKAASLSKVTINHYSTLGHELLGFKKKVLFFQPYIFESAPLNEKLPFKIQDPSYEIFEESLLNLLNMDIDTYQLEINEAAKQFNNLDQNDIIKEIREKYLIES